MAVYKVAQDVEADDKLLGPFSFRQFIYLIVVAIAIALAYGLSRLFLPLAIIPLPVIVFFGALALPLRKDQPMEVYVMALLSYYLKPRKRLWKPDGIESLVEITAPKIIEVQRTKDLSQSEAERRFEYLASLADTGGWAIRHAAMPTDGNAMISDVFNEAQQAPDILDTSSGVGQTFDTMINQADARRHEQMVNMVQHPQAAPTQAVPTQPIAQPAPVVVPPVADPYQALAAPQPTPAEPVADLHYNPYPTSIHQGVIQPLSQQAPVEPVQPAVQSAPEPAPSTSGDDPSPDIINLANNSDLSIETLAREAHRIQDKDDEKEVVISLR